MKLIHLIVENLICIARQPPWIKLLNSSAYVLKFIRTLTKTVIHSANDLRAAEFALIKAVQSSRFINELTVLFQNRN